jgi:sialate O-acetylesterase
MKTSIFLVVCLLAPLNHAVGAIQLPAVISDNMVLQAGVKDRLWGTADPSERIRVTVGGEQADTTADANGRWTVEIGPLQPGGPYELTLRGTNTLVVRNVLVGEVWICSGQSNMEFPVAPGPSDWRLAVENYEQEVADANYPEIRMFTVTKSVAGKPQKDLQGRWEVTSPVTVGHFSAVGYFFARDLFRTLHEPMGMIHTSWGGTPAEAWTSLPTLEADPSLSSIVQKWREQETKFLGSLDNVMGTFDTWRKDADQAEAEGAPVPPPPALAGDPRANPYRPAGLFNAMLAPLLPYRIKGAIWYQGEANSGRAYLYRKLFPAMIGDWRREWGEGDFPFLFVQLANFQDLGTISSFALLREAQFQTLAVPNTAMAVTIDIGSPITVHPRNKQEVGRRLSLAARALAYGEKIEYSGPLYDSMQIEGDHVRVRLSHLGGGLVAADGGNHLKGFEVAGADQRYVSAVATVDGDTVVVKSMAIPSVPAPVAVRYDWGNNPLGNFYNETGLPASPFRTDDWPDASGQKP